MKSFFTTLTVFAAGASADSDECWAWLDAHPDFECDGAGCELKDAPESSQAREIDWADMDDSFFEACIGSLEVDPHGHRRELGGKAVFIYQAAKVARKLIKPALRFVGSVIVGGGDGAVAIMVNYSALAVPLAYIAAF